MGYLLNRPSIRALRLVREILGVFIGYIHIGRDMDVYMERRSQDGAAHCKRTCVGQCIVWRAAI